MMQEVFDATILFHVQPLNPKPYPAACCPETRANGHATWRRTVASNMYRSYLRLIDFVYHSTLGSRVIKKQTRDQFII